MRIYSIDASSHGRRTVSPIPLGVTASHAKVGEVALVMFRRIFGRNPNRYFVICKGRSATAEDRRGNSITIMQINDCDRPGFDRAIGTFPIIQRKGGGR